MAMETKIVECPYCGQPRNIIVDEDATNLAIRSAVIKACDCEPAQKARALADACNTIDKLFSKETNQAYHSSYDMRTTQRLQDLCGSVWDEDVTSYQIKLPHDDVVTIKKVNGRISVERKKTLKTV